MALPRPGAPAGRLFVVSTPIGNLEDITLRAVRVLTEAALVCAEDTRRTGHLLRHYEIRTPLLSLHAHNEAARVPGLLARLGRGEDVAVVTDAGTPGVSDPGMLLVVAARAAGATIEVIPGPSAVLAALAVCGLASVPFVFKGFAEVRSKHRKQWLSELNALSHLTVVCFEAPHRIQRFLGELIEYSVDRPIFVCRELTKIHEEVLHGTPQALVTRLPHPKGEFTIVIPAKARSERDQRLAPEDAEILDLFSQIADSKGLYKRGKARLVAGELGVTTRAVYEALERSKPLAE